MNSPHLPDFILIGAAECDTRGPDWYASTLAVVCPVAPLLVRGIAAWPSTAVWPAGKEVP